MSHNIMDDPLLYMDDMPVPLGTGGDQWGSDDQGEVDVELLAEAFFDNAGDFGIGDSDPVAQQIIDEERDGMFAPLPVDTRQQQNNQQQYQQQFQQQQPKQYQQGHQVVTPPSTSPLLAMGRNAVPVGAMLPDSAASQQQQQRLSFQPSQINNNANIAAAGGVQSSFTPTMINMSGGGGNTMNGVPSDMAQMMQSMMAAAAAANNASNAQTGAMVDPNQQAFMFAANGGGGGGPVAPQMAMLNNPFLNMAAGMPMVDRAQFLEAAFMSRQKGRRQMSTEQAERRRERNRQLAKKTRDKKKDYMGTLQDEILELQRQNAELKAMVKQELDQKDSQAVLDGCDAIDKVPDSVWEACGTDKNMLSADDFDMVSSIQKSQTAFCITDPSFDDNPIVFCSPDFLTLTGYSRDQVIGRNCRFLQGQATCPDKVAEIRKALVAGEDVGITLINYKADGTPFWNRLFIAAVRDVNDQIVNYMGVVVQVARPDPDDPEFEVELPE